MTLDKAQLTEQQRKKISARAITSQSLGMQGMLAFQNGILLLYMTALGLPPARIITYLALPTAISVIIRLPVAYKLDQIGRKKAGTVGVFLTAVGFTLLPIAGFFHSHLAEVLILTGIIILALGKTLFAPTWMPIIDSFVNPNERGRFFARMRLTLQFAGMIIAAATAYFVKGDADPPIYKYIIVLFILAGCLYGRWYFYSTIPEITSKNDKPNDIGFFNAIKNIISNGDFIAFSTYIFLLTLFTAATSTLFSLIEKNVMKLDGSAVILLTNITMIGTLIGLFVGGKLIDKYGSKFAFLFCHIGFTSTIITFLMRNTASTPLLFVGIAHFALGLIGSLSGLARSTEMLALVPAENKSLSTSVALTLMLGAQSLSGFIAAWSLGINLINRKWSMLGHTMSDYDGILLIYSGMILLLTVTLSLVPSVVRKATWGAIPN